MGFRHPPDGDSAGVVFLKARVLIATLDAGEGQGIDANAVAPPVGGAVAGKVIQPGLCRRIGHRFDERNAGVLFFIAVDILHRRDHAVDRTDVDDRAAFAGLLHALADLLGHQEGADQIHFYHLAEHLFRELLKRPGDFRRRAGLGVDARVVNQAIRHAPLRFNAIQHPVNAGFIGNIHFRAQQAVGVLNRPQHAVDARGIDAGGQRRHLRAAVV